MKIFEVSKYLTLKLEDNKTNIYINGELFKQCKYVLMRKKVYELEDLLELESVDELAEKSIDDIAEKLDHSLEGIEPELIEIPAETIFWVHCSNMEIWEENNYDTRFLHSNLAFPLLKKLAEVDDPKARKVFKEEIAKRLETGSRNVVQYLTREKYTEYLNFEELESCLNNWQNKFIEWWNNKPWDKKDSLNLNGCCLLWLPESIGNLIHLKLLDLEVNNLSKLPESICNLKLLSDLNVSINNLKRLPENIGRLKNLKIFQAYSNHILKLPKSFKNLQSLKEWNMSGNKLSEIPIFIDKLKSLKIVKLSLNKIKKLPESFGNLLNLEELNLSDNKLEILPDSFGNLKNLKHLDLRNNRLKSLPKSFCNLDSIKYIYLNNNRIEDLPKDLRNCKNIEVLNLTNNRLKNYPESLQEFIVANNNK